MCHRSLARVQERDVLHLFFAAAKHQGDTGDAKTAAAAVRLAKGLRKHLGVSCMIYVACFFVFIKFYHHV
jgi:hypothetical protein